MKCTAAPGSGSALRDSNGWLPPVAKHGRLQRLQRLHHRYQGFRETRLPGEPQLAYGNKQKPSRNEGWRKRRKRKRRRRRRRRSSSTAKSFAEVGKRRWGKFSFAGCL
ncbi:PREDICTED: uncharacterized protein LOC105147003 [Acromyrmex echinatior]|uniref:uncharacterized protein LOC105147003 n=1 Tax=Acromyrmex echinatior TaxID=103372 RepID=UPI000580E73B|nr:PREDICTED: uncharacterized protein LOC105147003 [Acromyrmex echinatior]